jgi:hypothetical protein
VVSPENVFVVDDDGVLSPQAIINKTAVINNEN